MSNLLDLLVEPLRYPFMVRGLLASLMVGTLCAVVGTYVVLRGMAFFGDALAHAILPGVAVAYLLAINLFWGALVMGLITAVGIGYLSRRSQVKEDTAIGVIFAASFALGVALLSTVRSYSVDLTHILFGNVLGVSNTDLWLTAGLGLVVLAVVFLLYKELLVVSFDPILAATLRLPLDALNYLLLVLIALTVVVSLQTVGVALMVAMLVTPAATAYLLDPPPVADDDHRRGHRRGFGCDRAVPVVLRQRRLGRRRRPGGHGLLRAGVPVRPGPRRGVELAEGASLTESFLTHLECGRCGRQYDADRLWNLCPECGKPLLARYDLPAAARALSPADLACREPSLWRYRELLPVRDPAHRLTLGEGWTPLVHADAAGAEVGLDRLYIKDEGLNPTGSFKARGMAVAISRARELGVTAISLPTAGNAGGAAAPTRRGPAWKPTSTCRPTSRRSLSPSAAPWAPRSRWSTA